MATRIPLALLATALACSLFAAPAHALRARVFVAKTGADAGGCSFSAPCQTLNFAYNAVLAGGEITILDNAGYEPLTISKALTITGPAGVEAGIAVPSGGTALTVNLSNSSDIVVLRGLTIDGGGVPANGISFTGNGSLTVLDCVVSNMNGRGMSITPTGGGLVVITDTTIKNNTGHGVFVQPTSGVEIVTLNHVKLIGNGFNSSASGFFMETPSGGFGTVSIDSSLITQNGVGLSLSESSANVARGFVINSTISDNKQSVNNGAGVQLFLEKTSISTIYPGAVQNNGTIFSFGDNAIVDSITGNAPSSFNLR